MEEWMRLLRWMRVNLEKMKYGKGRPVNGKWVFWRVLKKEFEQMFFRVVPCRTKECLLAVIKEWVLPGTTIISDCWASYNCLKDEGFSAFEG
ncbi:hypothetical protein TNCV_1423401 [Trichonephila clavipes]|nr:hypothetical protein TNCV_1423401 [Trichonephila clavipes]